MDETTYSGEGEDTHTYFTGKARGYDRYRPGYPAPAIEAILAGIDAPARVADIGCGTGIATRLLAEAGATVVGVDPNEEMLSFAGAAPSPAADRIRYVAGDSENTGLEAASLDVIVCAQAFHWFDTPATHREFHRVLSPGGRLCLIWNVRGAGDTVSAEYKELMDRVQVAASSDGRVVSTGRSGDPTAEGCFENLQRRVFQNAWTYDLEELIGRSRSASYFPSSGPRAEAFIAELRDLFQRHQRDGVVRITGDCVLLMAVRSPSPPG